jgi:hypothetical protein
MCVFNSFEGRETPSIGDVDFSAHLRTVALGKLVFLMGIQCTFGLSELESKIFKVQKIPTKYLRQIAEQFYTNNNTRSAEESVESIADFPSI